MGIKTSKVFVIPSAEGYITRIDGGYTSKNLTNPGDWVLIDEGYGDKYNLCQSNYLPLPLRTDGGAWRYKLVAGQVAECTPEEIAAQEAALPKPEVKPSLESRVDTLESTTDDMVLMLADIIGG